MSIQILVLCDDKNKHISFFNSLDSEFNFQFENYDVILYEKNIPFCDILIINIESQKYNLEELIENITIKLNLKLPIILFGKRNIPLIESLFEAGANDYISENEIPTVVNKTLHNIYFYKEERKIMVSNSKKLQLQAKALESVNQQLVDTLSSIIEFRNLESGAHVKRIRFFAEIILDNLVKLFPDKYNMSEDIKNLISLTSAMHDIGKIAIPDAILLKDGPLNCEERKIMSKHTIYGADIIDLVGFTDNNEFKKYCYDVVRYHHERYDGNGYPDGLKGEEIPISAQVVGIADVFDALVSKRPYKPVYMPNEAIEMINNGECGAFSNEMLIAFNASKEQLLEALEKLHWHNGYEQ